MKNKCSIVRDLMPLVIDGACSEESSSFVEEHVAECTPCAEVWDEMKAELPRMAAQRERAELEQAACAMKKKRRKRMLASLAAVVLLGAALLAGGQWLWHEMTLNCLYPMASDEYTVQLYRMSDGSVLLVYDLTRDDVRCAWGINPVQEPDTLHLQMDRPAIQLGNPLLAQRYGGYRTESMGQWEADGWMLQQEHLLADGQRVVALIPVQEVQIDYKEGPVTIYVSGDEVPLCSPELEEYAAQMEFFIGRDAGFWQKMTELRERIPEWQ